MNPVSDIAFSPSVKTIQERMGSRPNYARMEQGTGWKSSVTPQLADFLAERDTFFLGTVNADGQPYIQHRGGPKGFLKVIDEPTLGFGDVEGNRQYITPRFTEAEVLETVQPLKDRIVELEAALSQN